MDRGVADACGEPVRIAAAALGVAVVVSVAGAWWPAAAGASLASTPGELRPAAAPALCGPTGPRSCRAHRLLRRPAAVAFSPDGRHLYAVDRGAGAVFAFRRSAHRPAHADGLLRRADGRGLRQTRRAAAAAERVQVSPDGRTLLVTSVVLAHFSRDSGTGTVGYLGCVAERGSSSCGAGDADRDGTAPPTLASCIASAPLAPCATDRRVSGDGDIGGPLAQSPDAGVCVLQRLCHGRRRPVRARAHAVTDTRVF